MAEFDAERNRLTLKVVYYGPALAGKTSNLTRLHDLLNPGVLGDLMTLETQGDRTLYFDLLPMGFRAPSGLLIKFKMFTVPGQVAHDGTRKAVLSRADGVVFVADSQRQQSINNGASFENLVANAGMVGLDLETLPMVVQFNKRDLPDILSEADIAQRWGSAPWPVTLASALEGTGVRETFATLRAALYERVDAQYELASRHGLSRQAFVESIQ